MNGLKKEENVRQVVQNDLQTIKEKIRQLESGSGSGSTVGCDASMVVVKGPSGTLQGHRLVLVSDSTISLCRGRWNSKDGSQTTNNVATRGSLRPRCRISSRTCTGWYLIRVKSMWNGANQDRTSQIMVSMWFSNETNLPTMVGLLDIKKEEFKNEPLQTARLCGLIETGDEPEKEAIGEGPCFGL